MNYSPLRFRWLITVALTALALPAAATAAGRAPRGAPNIVYILCDDLGYGDVQCLNPARGKIKTPNVDRLAAQGMTFTDAHSGSSVCTPTRYGVLTGRYSWRTHLQSGVLGGFSPPLIAPDRLTVAEFLRQHGYRTACLGKWHLGWDWAVKPGGSGKKGAVQANVDYTGAIKHGPTTVGFDYFFGISASLDMAPFVFIENDHVTAIPTVEKTFVRTGPAAPDFEAQDVLPTLARKAAAYVKEQGPAARQGTPFFLYLPLNSPHAPILPTKEWQGKSGLGDYADFVMETDWAVGEVLAAIQAAGVADNTLVIFTSDNGCSPVAQIPKLEAQGHYPSAGFRGYKSDIWEGGHRVPFIARWPGHVAAGAMSSQLICLTDLMATCAELVGAQLPLNAGEDSVSILPALVRGERKPLREAVVNHSISGRFALRQGRWKLEMNPGSGGWGAPNDFEAKAAGRPEIQLYDLQADPGETRNLQAEQPAIVAQLKAVLERTIADGRSTPGAKAANDSPIVINKPNVKSLAR
jgi:arylsulfatase A